MTPARKAVVALRAAYHQHVEDLAESLRVRLVAGEFTVPVEHDNIDRWNTLEDICRDEPRPWGDEPALTYALASPKAKEVARAGYNEDDFEGLAAAVIAWEVRELAIARWGAPRDNIWAIAEGRDEDGATQAPASA